MNWTASKQWQSRVGEKGSRVLITINCEIGPRGFRSQSYTWWLDPQDTDARPVYCQSPAISLTEAKRRATKEATALIERLVAAKGGA